MSGRQAKQLRRTQGRPIEMRRALRELERERRKGEALEFLLDEVAGWKRHKTRRRRLALAALAFIVLALAAAFVVFQ